MISGLSVRVLHSTDHLNVKVKRGKVILMWLSVQARRTHVPGLSISPVRSPGSVLSTAEGSGKRSGSLPPAPSQGISWVGDKSAHTVRLTSGHFPSLPDLGTSGPGCFSSFPLSSNTWSFVLVWFHPVSPPHLCTFIS